MGDSAYSFSLTTFSRTGKLLQIEYALNAVSNGRSSLGICARNGVVIVSDKKVQSPLVPPSGVSKIEPVTPSAGLAFSGIGPDYRVLVRQARKVSQSYFKQYREQQPTLQLVKSVAGVMQQYTQSGGVRPFGVSLLVAGYDDEGPALYQVDPSGAYFGWKATAIGKNYASSKAFLEKRFSPEMELEDAVHTALLTLREGFEGEMSAENIEVAIVDEKREFRKLDVQEIQDYLDEAS